MQKTVALTVNGIVQGVYYRQSAKKKAAELGIAGTVKNETNGNVAIVATGTDLQLEKFMEWCRQGPSTAVVSSVTIQELPYQDFKSFDVIR